MQLSVEDVSLLHYLLLSLITKFFELYLYLTRLGNGPSILAEIIKTENFKRQAVANALKATGAERKRPTQIAEVDVEDTHAANGPSKSATGLDEEGVGFSGLLWEMDSFTTSTLRI